jgi:putative hydrolase of the HAD superfamily
VTERPFDAVLFDFRGTVFNIQDDPAWIRSAASYIGRDLGDDEVVALCEHLDETIAARPDLAEALERCDTSIDVHRAALLAWFAAAQLDDELAHAIWSHDHEHAEANFPFPDTEPVMRALHEHGVKVAIVSDIHYDIRAHFVRHGLDGYVDTYVLSFEHGVQKPDRRIFEIALGALEAEPADALMIGDRASHDGGAVKAGIETWLLPEAIDADRPRGLDRVLAFVA